MDLTAEESGSELSLADMGELAGLVTHEFNDVLNTILLHVAVLEQTVADSARRDLAEIRKHGKDVAGLVKQFQRYRYYQRAPDRPIDLNATVSAAAGAFSKVDQARISLCLEPRLPPVM